jgi:hypothetical protein
MVAADKGQAPRTARVAQALQDRAPGLENQGRQAAERRKKEKKSSRPAGAFLLRTARLGTHTRLVLRAAGTSIGIPPRNLRRANRSSCRHDATAKRRATRERKHSSTPSPTGTSCKGASCDSNCTCGRGGRHHSTDVGVRAAGCRVTRVILNAKCCRRAGRIQRPDRVRPLRTRHIILILRDRDRRQNTDDRDHDHQFDQGKTLLNLFHHSLLY